MKIGHVPQDTCGSSIVTWLSRVGGRSPTTFAECYCVLQCITAWCSVLNKWCDPDCFLSLPSDSHKLPSSPHTFPDSTYTPRGIVAFNFSPRNLTQGTSAMKPLQDTMDGFSSVRELLFAKGYIKDRTRIKQPKLNLVTVGRDSSFPCPPGAGKGMPWLSHS